MKTRIFCLILLTLCALCQAACAMCVLGALSELGNDPSEESTPRNAYERQQAENEARFSAIIAIAIEKVEQTYPEFNIDPDTVYVMIETSLDEYWYAFVYSEDDRAMSVEVFCNEGEYRVKLDYPLYEARRLLIDKMNELMPYNERMNRYVDWGFNSYYQLGYVVAAHRPIDIDEQILIDYEIWQFANELWVEMEFGAPGGLFVAYYEYGESVDFDDLTAVTKEKSKFARSSRAMNPGDFSSHINYSRGLRTDVYYGKVDIENKFIYRLSKARVEEEEIHTFADFAEHVQADYESWLEYLDRENETE